MSKIKISFRFYGVKGSSLFALALTLMATIVALGSAFSRPVFVEQALDIFAPETHRSALSPFDVAVALPSLSSTPGVVLVPITVGDLTSQGIFSYDLQVTFDPSVVTPASPAFLGPGTLSSASSINANTANSGHLILGAFQGSPFDGSGVLIFLRFNVVGTSGQSTSLTFEDYVDPTPAPHAGFRFNEGTPVSVATNGSITVIGSTPTNTATNTATSTPTATNTPTFSPTNTPSVTPTRTPTGTATNTPAFSPTSTATPTATATPICVTASMPSVTTLTNVSVTVPVNTADMAGTGANSVSFTVTYSAGVMSFNGVTFGPVGTSNGGGRTLSFSTPTSGTINISIFGGNDFIGSGTLVNLNFSVFALPGSQSLLGFSSFQVNGGQSCGTLTGGGVTVVAGTITGKVTYANVLGPPSPRYVPSVTIVGSGSPSVAAATDALGAYSLSGFGAGSYSISPFKAGGANGAVSGFDAARIAQYVVNLISFTPTQLAAADVSGSGNVSSFDSTLIARYIVALPGSGAAGEWSFSPESILHGAIYSNIANENYTALLMGEVSGNWNSPGPLPGRATGSNGPLRSAAVKAPNLIAAAGDDLTIPVNIQGAANKGIVSYEFDLRYDPTVIQPQARAVDLAGTASRGLTAVANPTQPGLLRVIVFGAMPIDGNGVLLNLRFTAVGTPGSVSPLTWERLVLNEGDPRAVTVDGSVEVSKAVASEAEIGGRVLNAFGEGVSGARVTLTDTTGRSRTILTNGFGAYRFANLQIGQTYTVTASAKSYVFSPLTVSATGELTNLNLVQDNGADQ